MSRFPPLFPGSSSSGPLFPSGWDVGTLGGVKLPGRQLMTSGALKLKVDPKKKAGAIAQKPTTHGLDAQHFGLRVVVWTDEQLAEADDALAILLPPVNTTPVTLDHPQVRTLARMVGKIDVLVESGSIWSPSGVVRGGMEMTISLLHWPAAAKGKGASNTAQKPTRNLVTEKAAARANAIGAGTVLANPKPTDSPTFANPTWP